MKCPYCGAETRYAKCEFCDSVIEQSAGETVNEIFQDVTRNVTQNIVQNITINPDTTITDISKKSKSTAIALCCLGFVGLGGIHRFYAGKIGTGLIWLCTAGCFGIGTVIDLVSIIINKFDDSKEKRISKW
ncbi:MAG: TM2 domain-containing protein [Ruminococcus sp.]|nr:TM2 domain-containing protein [Ruminococcus sp.]